jgi:hypothetical protein
MPPKMSATAALPAFLGPTALKAIHLGEFWRSSNGATRGESRSSKNAGGPRGGRRSNRRVWGPLRRRKTGGLKRGSKEDPAVAESVRSRGRTCFALTCRSDEICSLFRELEIQRKSSTYKKLRRNGVVPLS